jgi:hypothetical protein
MKTNITINGWEMLKPHEKNIEALRELNRIGFTHSNP